MLPHSSNARPLNRTWQFFVLAYAISWLCYLPFIIIARQNPDAAFAPILSVLSALGNFGPLIAALIMASLDGRGALTDLRNRLLRWRVPWFWYAVALGWEAVHLLVSTALVGMDLAAGSSFETFPLYALPIVFAVVFVTAGLAEEVGWRGYALPRLQTMWSPLASSVVLGLVWAFWHLPGYLLPNTAHSGKTPVEFLWYVAGTVAFTIIITWVFNGTGGSVLLTMLLHTASNTTQGFLPSEASLGTVDVVVVTYWLAALGVIFAGRMWRAPATAGKS